MFALGPASIPDHLMYHTGQQIRFTLTNFALEQKAIDRVGRSDFFYICQYLSILTPTRGALTVTRGLDQPNSGGGRNPPRLCNVGEGRAASELTSLMTVVVSMSVSETVKGTPRKSIVFRQYIWDLRDQIDTAQYRKGEELLLLGAESENGLTSPVGLEQGRFRVVRDKNGEALAVNGRDTIAGYE
jgi:hypothetical protein